MRQTQSSKFYSGKFVPKWNRGKIVSVTLDNGYNQVESKFFNRVFTAFAILALLSLLISFAGRELGAKLTMGGHTDDTTSHEIIIGNDVIVLPANMIRYPEQRRDGVANRLDLYVMWPTMRGYTSQSKAIFNNAIDKKNKLIFISVEPRTLSRDMSDRYEPIYKAMIDKPGVSLSNGLTRFPLPEKSGFMDEELYVGPATGNRPFVARCLNAQTAQTSIAPCDRDIHIGDDLVLMVRFPAELLDNWPQLDAQLATFANTIVKTAK